MSNSTPTALSEWASKQRLVGLPLVAERSCSSAVEIGEAIDELTGPYVVKASGVAHKSEHGLVRVGLDVDEVLACWGELADAGDGSVLIAEMVKADFELVVGGMRDPHFGPVVTIGLGGVAAEVLRDAVTILAPPEPGEVGDAIATLKGAELLSGFRGWEPVDIAALEVVVNSVSDLLVSDPQVSEIDCNPVMISAGQPIVVDALVVLET